MEISNPFDALQSRFFILKNGRQQFSLWPEHCVLPPGWQVVNQPATGEECNRWLKDNWTDIQPRSFATQGVSGE